MDGSDRLSSLVERAMTPGAEPRVVIESLRDASAQWLCSVDGHELKPVPPPDDHTLGSQLARHAASILLAGGSLPEALDSALVRLLYTGEREALRREPEGDAKADPAGVRPLADLMRTWVDEVLGDAPSRPPVLRNRSTNLQLMTTRRCQLRCSYCPVVKGEADMPREIIDRSIDLLLTSSRDRIRLDFTGGEPLLRWEEVQRAAMRAITGGETFIKDVGFYMVTNGFELTQARAEELASYGFRVELSLDGSEEAHNRCKIPVDSSDNPYRRTLEAIEAAQDARLPHTVVMVVTPDTVSSLPSSFEHAIGLGVRSIDLNYAIGSFWDEKALDAYLSALDGIVADHASLIRSGALEIGNLGSRVEPAVLNAEWMVDTDGSLHLMTEWALESSRPGTSNDLSLGHVRDVKEWDSLYAGRFHAYDALLRTYSWRDGSLRRLLHNNVRTGRLVSRHVGDLRRSTG